MKLKKTIRHNIYFLLVFSWVALFRVLPRRAGIALARLLAVAFYGASGQYRRNTIRHLTMAFGHEKSEAEIRRLAFRVFLHFAVVSIDAIRIPVYSRKEIRELIPVRDLRHLEAAQATGKGFVLLAGHFGNWELLGAFLAREGLHLHVVGAALSNPKINRLVTKVRNSSGCVTIERGNATRGIVRALKNGFPVALLIDQDTRVKGVFVDFFGKMAHTSVGPAVLAGMLSVPILPIAMWLRKDLTYALECLPPLYYRDTGNRWNDILDLTRKCSRACEQIIRRHPEQWVWMHERWKKQPGMPVKKKYLLAPPV